MQEKMAFVFPGQGAQHVGMGADIFHEYAAARHVFEQVSDYVGRDIAHICFYGPTDVLNKPENTSLGTFANSVAIANIVADEFDTPIYKIAYAVAGHSAGQYAALHCADSLTMRDAVALLSARATYMSAVTGGMACIVGLPLDTVRQILDDAKHDGFAAISNHNSYDQFVISGKDAAIDRVVVLGRERGAKLARRLNVAIPAHCALMRDAAKKLREELSEINVESPRTNWFSNETANIMNNPIDVKNALADQMTHGVRWLEIMEKFPEYKITRAYELGPGQTLTRLINRTIGDRCVAAPCNNLATLRNMLATIEKNLKR